MVYETNANICFTSFTQNLLKLV